MNKDFVPYKESVDLKEIGFDEPCIGYYSNSDKKKGRLLLTTLIDNNHNSLFTDNQAISSPLYQQAFRWFRKKHKLGSQSCRDGGWWIINICDFSNEEEESPQRHLTFVKSADEYEEAELNCLRKLIEMIKEKK